MNPNIKIMHNEMETGFAHYMRQVRKLNEASHPDPKSNSSCSSKRGQQVFGPILVLIRT